MSHRFICNIVPSLVLENKITFAIMTVAIAAVVAGISTIVLNDGIQSVAAQQGLGISNVYFYIV